MTNACAHASPALRRSGQLATTARMARDYDDVQFYWCRAQGVARPIFGRRLTYNDKRTHRQC
eukprot:9593604-Alexandrium_andersonii.AAC.1